MPSCRCSSIVLGVGWVCATGGSYAGGAALAAWWFDRKRRDPVFREAFDGWLLRRRFAGALVAKIETARLARTLGTLVRNGVPLMTALGIGRNVLGNRVLAADVEMAANESRTASRSPRSPAASASCGWRCR
jgi:type II secretory pathway component PulF